MSSGTKETGEEGCAEVVASKDGLAASLTRPYWEMEMSINLDFVHSLLLQTTHPILHHRGYFLFRKCGANYLRKSIFLVRVTVSSTRKFAAQYVCKSRERNKVQSPTPSEVGCSPRCVCENVLGEMAMPLALTGLPYSKARYILT